MRNSTVPALGGHLAVSSGLQNDQEMPRLSVALCTYNGEKHIQAQLDSIVGQTRSPDELVVRDDGSTDDTVAIVEAFARTAPFPVRVLASGENLGYVRNFETVISACAGDLIALSDQDDVWLPHKLEALERALGEDPDVLLAFSDAALVGPALEPLGKTMWQAVGLNASARADFDTGGVSSPLLRGFYVTGATVCFRASLVPLALPIDLPHWHDAWLALAAAAYGRLALVDEPLILYRQHGQNTLGAPSTESKFNRIRKALWGRAMGERPLSLRVRPETEALVEPFLRDVAAYALAARDRFSDSPSPEFRRHLALRAAHAARRAAMPHRSRVSQTTAVIRSFLAGNYHKFDTGKGPVILDLRR